MRILIITSEKRDDFSSTPSLLALALGAMNHKVLIWRNSFFEKFTTPVIKLDKFKKEINEYDIVIATNCGQKILDFSNINEIKKIFLCFEDFDSPILPLGEFDEIWTGKNMLNLLKYCNPLQTKPITTRLIIEPAIAPEYWNSPKAWNKRKIKVAYNGALQDPKKLDPLLHYYMISRYKFCFELRELLHKEGIGLRLPHMKRNEISTWKEEFRDTKINLHLSQEFGVGQGALEAGLNRCALVEYCPIDLAEEFGLKSFTFERINKDDLHNCIIVQNVKEAKEAIKYLIDNDNVAERLGKKLYTLTLKHSYLKFIPLLDEILNE